MASIVPEKQTAAVCGLLCLSCGLYQATREKNSEQLKLIAGRLQLPVDQVQSNGCRSTVLSGHCQNCQIRECSEKKGIEFCSACPDYPCAHLKEFQAKMPHRAELFQSLERIKEAGWQQWYVEAAERSSCTNCHTLNSWYELTCKNCGNRPANRFIADNFAVLGGK